MIKFTPSIPKILILGSFSLLLNDYALGKSLSDSQITSEVKTVLTKENDIPAKKLKVSTNEGIVTVEGKVETRLQADKIVELVNSIEEVKAVDSSKLKTVSSNQYIKDACITAAIKGKIVLLTRKGQISKESMFNIETTNGNVYIFGRVKHTQEIDTIIQKIYEIKEVKKVCHSIEVLSKNEYVLNFV